MTRLMRVLSTLVLGLMVAPAVALAGTDPISGTPGEAQGVEGTLSASGGGALPFTGLDLALIVIAGVALIVAGVVLRRRTSSAR